MHLEKVLVDWKQFRIFDLLYKVLEILTVSNLELLLWIFVLFHIEAVLNDLVPLHVLLIFRAPEGIELSHVLLQVQDQEEEDHDAHGVRWLEDHPDASEVFIFSDEAQRDKESDEVEEDEDFGGAECWPMSVVLKHTQDEGVRDNGWLPR